MAQPLQFSSPSLDGALSLPLVLSEGCDRVHVGTLSVHPSVGFRALQLEVSKVIGVPPHQMLSFLQRSSSHPIPIDENLDLSVLTRQGDDWQILAVLRRSRNGRNRRGRRTKGSSRGLAEDRKPQPEKIILRRSDASNAPIVYDLMYGSVAMNMMPMYFYPPQICDIQTDRYGVVWGDTWHAEEPAQAVCGVCEAAACLGVDAAFHCCARDEIVEVGSYVRPAVGPIERPSRKRVAGCLA